MVRAIAANEQHSVQQRKSRMFSAASPGILGGGSLAASWGSNTAPQTWAPGGPGGSPSGAGPSPHVLHVPVGSASPHPGAGGGGGTTGLEPTDERREHQHLVAATRSLNAVPSASAATDVQLQKDVPVQRSKSMRLADEESPRVSESAAADHFARRGHSPGTEKPHTESPVEPANCEEPDAEIITIAIPTSSSGHNLIFASASATQLPQSCSNESFALDAAAAASSKLQLSPSQSSGSATLGSSAGSALLAATPLSPSASGSGSGASGLLSVKKSARRRRSFTEALFGPAHNGSSDEEDVDYTRSPPPPHPPPATPKPAPSPHPSHPHAPPPPAAHAPGLSSSPSLSVSPSPEAGSTNILTGCVGGGGGSGAPSCRSSMSTNKKHKSGGGAGGGIGGLVSMSEAALLAARATATLVAASIDSASRPLGGNRKEPAGASKSTRDEMNASAPAANKP